MNHYKSSLGVIVAASVAIILLAGIIIADPAMLSRTAIAGPISDAGVAAAATTTTTTTTTTTAESAEERVEVGGGNITFSVNQFSPQTVEIQAGESVTFFAPSGSTEVHNVIFDLTNGTLISDIGLPFILPPGVSSDNLQLTPPYNVGEPVIQNITTTDGDTAQAIIGFNKVAFHPSAVNQNGEVNYLQEQEFIQQIEQAMQQGLFMPPLSANYTMQGTERVVSSGLILDVMGFEALIQEEQGAQQEEAGGGVAEGQQQQEPTQGEVVELPPPANPVLLNFTVTFNEPGTYPYFCAFHPGMEGVVNVSEGDATTQNQTGIEEETLQTGTA